MPIKFEFRSKEGGPERLAAEVDMILDGDLGGLKFVGFSVWRGEEGEFFVTFPSRAFGAGGERRYFDYIRSVDGGAAPTKALKQRIISAYVEHAGVVPQAPAPVRHELPTKAERPARTRAVRG